MYDTIVAGNTSGTGKTATTSDVSGNVASASSYNLIGGVSSGLTNGVNGNLVGVTTLKLGPLAANGGPTQTIALLAGSPAIAAGSATIAGVSIPSSTSAASPGRPRNSTSEHSSRFCCRLYRRPTKPHAADRHDHDACRDPDPRQAGAVALPLVKKGKAAKGASKLKVASKKTHPGGGSAAKFHKAAAPKAKKHVALAKVHHPAAHAKKK